ncbi:Anaerobic nitric oxide reductase transcription regulator NorR [bioreactor metagenome]|uniref:Anaerobic nitric oxide reductase transcription regulator NorR n=1 Tax=bioreactor metagenome TaxID=1076179 RepID=A0A644VJM1_9ZZZZ
MDIQSVKTRFGILGNNPQLNKALEIALQVSVTNMSVLVTGESGVGKEVFSKIIHQYSSRKHSKYIAVNCGAIPEGTIESELFGHVKGAFTSADRDRKGYFSEADKGTIFLDEVGELPLSMQAKLLRVLESGEFLPVGSSKLQRVDVRIVAATNVNLLDAINKGRFREDLYYRLSQVSIYVPPLRERKDDIYLLFRRFAVDQAEKYKMPILSLTNEARNYLLNYRWKGNIRQLKNVTEQISIIEKEKLITLDVLKEYIPPVSALPMVVDSFSNDESFYNQKDILLSILNNKQQIDLLKKEIEEIKVFIKQLIGEHKIEPLLIPKQTSSANLVYSTNIKEENETEDEEEIVDNDDFSEVDESPTTLIEMEKKMIISALERAKGKRSIAAKELGISERTLYRKINEFEINL